MKPDTISYFIFLNDDSIISSMGLAICQKVKRRQASEIIQPEPPTKLLNIIHALQKKGETAMPLGDQYVLGGRDGDDG